MWKIVWHICLITCGTAIEFFAFEGMFAYSFRRRSLFWLRLACVLAGMFVLVFVLSLGGTAILDRGFHFDGRAVEWLRVGITLLTTAYNVLSLPFLFDERPATLFYAAVGGKAAHLVLSSVIGICNNLAGVGSIYMILFASSVEPITPLSAVIYAASFVAVYVACFFLFGRPFAKLSKQFDRMLNAYIFILFAVMLVVLMAVQGNNVVFYGGSKAIHNIFHLFIILFCLTIPILPCAYTRCLCCSIPVCAEENSLRCRSRAKTTAPL